MIEEISLDNFPGSLSINHKNTDLERPTPALSFTIILGDRGSGNTLRIYCIARFESAAVRHPTTAMSTGAVYSQAPLVTERREIRVLVLAPGTGNDVLRGELIVESLDYDDLHYTALSYTWSGSVGENFISLGGAPHYITENLSMALRRIRGPTRPRNMWIDAICINQADHEEKAVQVNMMGDVFASATRTIVWLGEKSANSDVAMDFIGSLRQGTLDQLDDDSKIEPTCWRAVNELMERKWWTRIWVVQEALVSRRVIIQCGEKRVDILNFVKLLGESRVEQVSDQPSPSPESPFKGILSNWYVHKNQVETSGLSLQALIFLTRGFHASVWRDRFFGLLGLATPEARSLVTPDYSNEVPDRLILIRLTMYFLRRSVQPLQYASVCRATNCPSWVPDWTAIDINLERHVTKARPKYSRPLLAFRAAEDRPRFEPPIENLLRYQEPLALLVRGIVVDRVDFVVHIPHLDCTTSADETRAKSIKTKLREWELGMMKFAELAWSAVDESQIDEQQLTKKGFVWTKKVLLYYLCDYLNSLFDPGSKFPGDDLWRLLRGEYDYRHSHVAIDSYREMISDYEAWMQCFPTSARAEQQSQDHCKLCEHCCKRVNDEGICAHCVIGHTICRNIAGRTMFVTEASCHQSVPFAAQEGDIICALLSSDSLFVMRKADETHWTLVGSLVTTHGFGGHEFWHVTGFRERIARERFETFKLR